MLNHWVIDRFENNIAVLENTQTREIIQSARGDLPTGAREGDVLVLDVSGCFIIDVNETNARAERINNRFDRLKKR